MRKRLTTLLSFLLILTMLLGGCGSASNSKDTVSESYYESNSGYSSDDYFEGQSSGSKNDTVGIVVEVSDEKLVYTCHLSIQTKDFSGTIASLRNLISTYGGIVQSEEQTDRSNNWYFSDYEKTYGTLKDSLTIRIPTENYLSFIDGVSGTGKVLSKNQYVQNITQAYNETSITIESLKTQETRLLEMMKDAKTIDEMLSIESRLSEVQNQLAIYQKQLNTMDTDVAYSTIYLVVEEVLEYTPTIVTYTFGDRLKNSFRNSWDNITTFLEDLLFFIIEDLPVILMVLAIIVLIIFLVIKLIRFLRKGKGSRAMKKQKSEVSFTTNETGSSPETKE